MEALARALVAALFFACFGHASAQDTSRLALGPGDVVRITVFQNADLTVEQRVDDSGAISFPFLGSVKVVDRTTSEIERSIAEGLEKQDVIKRPQVIVNVVQFRSRQISVLGQVARPGRYPLDLPTTVSDALANAGGIVPNGPDTVTLSRMENGKHVSIEIDVPSLFSPSGARKHDLPLRSGDVLYASRAPVFYIYGEVQRPGMFRLERGMTVMQALSAGGGPTLRGTERSLRVTRNGPDGPETFRVELSAPVKPDDVIYVRESLF